MIPPVTIIIADDCGFFRKAIATQLASMGVEIVATAANGADLIELVRQYCPEVVLMDIRMPVMDGIEASRYLQQHFPHVCIIAYTMHDKDDVSIEEMARAGAHGFLTKDADTPEVLRCIETVRHGGKYYCSSSKPVIDGMLRKKPLHNLQPHLVEVIHWLNEGLESKQIAEKMHKSVNTINKWRSQLLSISDTKNTAQLLKWAKEKRIVE